MTVSENTLLLHTFYSKQILKNDKKYLEITCDEDFFSDFFEDARIFSELPGSEWLFVSKLCYWLKLKTHSKIPSFHLDSKFYIYI